MQSYLDLWNQKWAVSLSAGLLLGVSFSPFPFPFNLLILPGFLALFRLTDLTGSAREMAYVSYAGLVLWNIITTYWLTFATIAGGVAAILANSAIMTLPLMLIWHIRHKPFSLSFSALAVPSVWLTYEFLHHRWDLSWPWITLGNSFATAPWLVQYIAVTGTLGITFWLVLSGWLIFCKASRPILLSILLIPPAGSLIRYGLYHPEPVDEIEIAIMQPNFDSYLDNAGYPNAIQPLVELLEFSDDIITSETRAVFWPENAVMSLIRQDYPGEADLLIRSYVEKWNIPLITGSSFMRRYEPDQVPPVIRGEFGGKSYNIYNSALGFYPDGSLPYYLKAKLVPLVERLPFLHTFSWLDRYGWIDWNNMAMFGRGESIDMFDINGFKVPALICYDSVYSDWVRRFVNQDAAFLVVITNDGWWGNTSGHIQHFDFARLRAVETGRTVLRSANNGLSGVIHSNGDVALKTTYWTHDHFTFNVPVYENKTFYVRYGDWIGWISLMITVIAVIRLKRL